MLDIELLELAGKVRELRSGSKTLEARPDSALHLYDTISAFANRDGGTIIFGLDPDRQYEVTGVDDVRGLEERILGQCREMVPEVRPLFTTAVMDGKTICSAEIPAAGAEERPCFYSGRGRTGGAFVRCGSENLPMPFLEIYSYDAMRKGIEDDLRVIEGASASLLCREKLQIYLNRMKDEGRLPQRFSDEELLDALLFCMRNMKVSTLTDPVTGMRTESTEYPLGAVREAILNALIHRDYSVNTEGTPVQVDLFTDRLEIHSPGMLCGGLTEEDLGNAGAVIRNKMIASMALDLMGMEYRSSGIRTIRREMASAGLPAPLFRNLRGEFTVTLFNGTHGVRHARRK